MLNISVIKITENRERQNSGGALIIVYLKLFFSVVTLKGFGQLSSSGSNFKQFCFVLKMRRRRRRKFSKSE